MSFICKFQEQQESIDSIENNIESAQVNVQEGTHHLGKVSCKKTTTLDLCYCIIPLIFLHVQTYDCTRWWMILLYILLSISTRIACKHTCLPYIMHVYHDLSVTNLLNDLVRPPLQKRRKIARLTLLHKAIHGESALEIPSYIKRCNCPLRSYHKDKFIELRPNTEAYRNSFYCRTIKEWNSLPSNGLDIVKFPQFKEALR